MKRISEAYQNIIASQLTNTIKLVISNKVKIGSIIVPRIECEAVVAALSNTTLFNREYDIEGLKMVLITKNDEIFDRLEEINDAPISKELKDYFYDDILSPKS